MGRDNVVNVVLGKKRYLFGILGIGVAVACAAVALAVRSDFDANQTWVWIRSQQPGLFRVVKNFVTEQDRDVRAIGTTRELPLLQLHLSRKDIAHFSDLYEKFEHPDFGLAYYAEHNLWRNAKLTYAGRTYDVKIKSHGRNPTNHRNGKYISLSVKLPAGEQIQQSRRFSLLVRDHFRPEKQIAFDLAKHFQLLVNQEQLVRVAINHWDEKLYFLDRRFNDSWTEAEGRPSLRIFGYNDTPYSSVKSSIHTDGEFDREAFEQRFLQTLEELEYPPSQHRPLCDRFLALNQAIADQRVDLVDEFFDLEYLANFEAVRMIAGLVGHSIGRSDNLYMFYDTANGRFYPAITRDTSMSAMRFIRGGSPELYINTAGVWELPLFRVFRSTTSCGSGATQRSGSIWPTKARASGSATKRSESGSRNSATLAGAWLACVVLGCCRTTSPPTISRCSKLT